MALNADNFEDRREAAIALFEINRDLNTANGAVDEDYPTWTELDEQSKDTWLHIAKQFLGEYEVTQR